MRQHANTSQHDQWLTEARCARAEVCAWQSIVIQLILAAIQMTISSIDGFGKTNVWIHPDDCHVLAACTLAYGSLYYTVATTQPEAAKLSVYAVHSACDTGQHPNLPSCFSPPCFKCRKGNLLWKTKTKCSVYVCVLICAGERRHRSPSTDIQITKKLYSSLREAASCHNLQLAIHITLFESSQINRDDSKILTHCSSQPGPD